MLHIYACRQIADLVLAVLFQCQLGPQTTHSCKRYAQRGFDAAQNFCLSQCQHSRLRCLLSHCSETRCTSSGDERIVSFSFHQPSGISEASRRRENRVSTSFFTPSRH